MPAFSSTPGRRPGKTVALSLALCLLAGAFPWTVFAQTDAPALAIPAAYEGSAEGTVATLAGKDDQGAQTEVTLSESSGAVDSDALDVLVDGTGDFAAGKVTPLRIDSDEFGSEESSAPPDEQNRSNSLAVSEDGASLTVDDAVTASEADLLGDFARTDNYTEISDAQTGTDPATAAAVGSGDSLAAVSGTRDGRVQSVSEANLRGPSQLLGGLITVEAISALSQSFVESGDATSVTNFVVANLELRSGRAAEDPVLLKFNAGPAGGSDAPPCDDLSASSSSDQGDVEVAVAFANPDGSTSEVACTLPGGANLLDPSVYQDGSPLQDAVVAAHDFLTGPTGPLAGSDIALVLARSDSAEDEGYASAELEVLRLTVSPQAEAGVVQAAAVETVDEAVLGRVFSEAAFAPEVVAEEPPTEEPPAEEPPTEEPPTDEPPAEEPDDDATTDDDAGLPEATDTVVPMDSSGGSSPVSTGSSTVPQAAGADGDGDGGELPFTGFEPWILALLGGAGLAGGVVLRRRLRPTPAGAAVR